MKLATLFALIATVGMVSARTVLGADSPRIVVQLSADAPEAAVSGMRNVENILVAATHEKNPPEIKILVFSGALKHFTKSASPDVKDAMKGLLTRPGVSFEACENTLKKMKISASELLDGFTVVPSGAWEVLKLQKSGYLYFHP